MPSVQIKDVPAEVHAELRRRAGAAGQSLQEYLLEQFSFFSIEHTQREFGEYLIQHLDHNGRMQSMLPEIAQQFNRLYDQRVSMEQADEVLKLIQHLDHCPTPCGIGCSSDLRAFLR